MKRTTLNLVVDLICFVDLLLLAVTGIILKWVLPPGSGGRGHGLSGGHGGEHIRTLWNLGRHAWGDVHFVLSVLFVFLMLVHIVFHWTWIKTCATSTLFPTRNTASEPEDEPGMQ